MGLRIFLPLFLLSSLSTSQIVGKGSQMRGVFLWKENFQIKTAKILYFFFPGLSNCIPSLRLLTDHTTLSSVWRKFHENESISMLDVDLLLKQPMFLSVVRTTHRNRNGLH
jgi:hypothetical protein